MLSATRELFDLVCTAPEELAPRLMLADWYDAQGDHRGEFIRIQIALDRLPLHHPQREDWLDRERELLGLYKKSWTGTLESLGITCGFSRGMIEELTLTVPVFLEQAQYLFANFPIRRIRFDEVNEQLSALVQSPYLGKIRELDLCNNFLGNVGPTVLARSPYLKQLDYLNFAFNEITDSGLKILSEIDALQNLKHLVLNDNSHLGTPGIRALADSPVLNQLETLEISGNELTSAAFRVIINGECLRNLKRLVLHGNRLGDAGIAAFARSKLLDRSVRRVPVLELMQCEIGPAGIQTLCESDAMLSVEKLDLGKNRLGDAGVRALAQASRLSNLQYLNLSHNQITDQGLKAFMNSPLLDSLRELDLRDNVVTEESCAEVQQAALARNRTLPLQIHVSATVFNRRALHRR